MYRHILNQTIKVSAITGSNDYSETTYAAPVDVAARVDTVNKTKISPTGEAIQIAAKILIMPEDAPEAGSKIEYEGVNYKVESAIKTPGANGKIAAVSLECSEWR